MRARLVSWGLRIGYRCLGALGVFLKLLRHHLDNLRHHARQFILTPAGDLPRPLEVGRDLIAQGPDLFCLECAGHRAGALKRSCTPRKAASKLESWAYFRRFGFVINWLRWSDRC